MYSDQPLKMKKTKLFQMIVVDARLRNLRVAE